MYNNVPLMIQTPPHEGSLHIPQLNGGPNPVPTHHFPFQVGHSTRLAAFASSGETDVQTPAHSHA